MDRQRDLRTAHEKWAQNMAEGHRRGWFQILTRPPPEGIFGGWDHTKKPNRYISTDITPNGPRSRGKIPPNVRDDTEDTVSTTVTAYEHLDNVDQTQTRRTVIQGLPAQKEPTTTDLPLFLKDMKHKDGMLENINHVGGLRWIEWCAWDEEFVWKRYQDGFAYKGYPNTTTDLPKVNLSSDLGYRKVREDMERIAIAQGIPSWTTLMRGDSVSERIALEQRFNNYMDQLFTERGSMDYLPDSWALCIEGRTQQYPSQLYSPGDSKPEINKASLPSWWIGHLFHRLEMEWNRRLEEMAELVGNERGKAFTRSGTVSEISRHSDGLAVTDPPKFPPNRKDSRPFATQTLPSEARALYRPERRPDLTAGIINEHMDERDVRRYGTALYPSNEMRWNESIGHQQTQRAANQRTYHVQRVSTPAQQKLCTSMDEPLTVTLEGDDSILSSAGPWEGNVDRRLRTLALGNIGSGRRVQVPDASARDRFGFSEDKSA
jgi:hypothetical protein